MKIYMIVIEDGGCVLIIS